MKSKERKELEERIETNEYCCWECGVQYLTEKQKQEEDRISTAHTGICVCCQQEKTVVHIRAYNWLKEPKTK